MRINNNDHVILNPFSLWNGVRVMELEVIRILFLLLVILSLGVSVLSLSLIVGVNVHVFSVWVRFFVKMKKLPTSTTTVTYCGNQTFKLYYPSFLQLERSGAVIRQFDIRTELSCWCKQIGIRQPLSDCPVPFDQCTKLIHFNYSSLGKRSGLDWFCHQEKKKNNLKIGAKN